MKPHPRGADAEAAARRFLRRQGLRITTSNYHCRWGEIDIIAEHGASLVFVEVRRRRRADVVSALDSVDARKRERLRRAALSYLQRTGQNDRPCRFDILGFGDDPDEPLWVRDAF